MRVRFHDAGTGEDVIHLDMDHVPRSNEKVNIRGSDYSVVRCEWAIDDRIVEPRATIIQITVVVVAF